jgi:Subtilase family
MRANKTMTLLLAFSLFAGVFPLKAETNTLVWHKNQDTVDADISSWNVLQLLEHVAANTGWKVYLDPGAIHGVSVKFKGMPSSEALHAMLGNLNFMLVPETNAQWRFYVFRVSRQQATRLVAPPKVAKPIPNQLVVTLKPGSKTKIEDLARALNAKIIGRMDGQNAYLLQFPDATATQLAGAQLASNPDVSGLENNYPMESPPTMAASNNGSPNLQLNPVSSGNNKQLVVGLIDTPVQSLGANLDSFMQPAIHVAGDVSLSADQLTHGTAMAETILQSIGTATGGNSYVKIQPVDVYGNNQTTSTFDVANGIVQAVNNGADILNLSLGGTGDSQILRDTIANVLSRGIPIYAAAGNEPVTTPTYPAAYPGVIAVTAIDPTTGQIASYANRGSFIDIAASGTSIVNFDGQTWQVEGTSSATALVTGEAAGLADAHHAPANQAQSLLQSSLPHSSLLKTGP